MPTPDKPIPKRHYFKLPQEINKMADAEIDAFAAELYERIMSVMPNTLNENEKGGEK